jgi:hypothetical protein
MIGIARPSCDLPDPRKDDRARVSGALQAISQVHQAVVRSATSACPAADQKLPRAARVAVSDAEFFQAPSYDSALSW